MSILEKVEGAIWVHKSTSLLLICLKALVIYCHMLNIHNKYFSAHSSKGRGDKENIPKTVPPLLLKLKEK